MRFLALPTCIYHPSPPLGTHVITVTGCGTRVGWKVHRLTMMQWSNLTKCGLFFNAVSPAVHTLLPSVLQRLDARGIETLILILNYRYDLIIGPILLPGQVLFSCLGTENSQMENNGGWWTSFKPQSRTAAIAIADLCAGVLSRWNRTPFVSFPGHFERTLLSKCEGVENPLF